LSRTLGCRQPGRFSFGVPSGGKTANNVRQSGAGLLNKVGECMSVWTDEVDKRLKQLRDAGHSQFETAERLSEEFGNNYTRNAVRHREDRMKNQSEDVLDKVEYKETVEILADGSHKSDKLLKMNSEQAKDVDYLLEAHGFDKGKWELVNAKNNIWNSYSKQDGIMTLYSSKVTVKPKVNGFNWDELIEEIKNVQSITIEPEDIPNNDLYLNLPLFDMHFGISDYEHYKPTQAKILRLLEKNYKEVLIIIGQDLLHNDDMRGRTASGREIDKVDMIKAWGDATAFYEPIIMNALKNSLKVKIMYSKGNHDESMSWAFVQYLSARFPQAEFDTSFRERKVHMLGLNFCGVNHGDKRKEVNLSENFATEFPIEWSMASTRTIFTGHLHSERVIDKGGVIIRRMPTGNKLDQYHDDHGYTTAHKRFQVHEYCYEEELSIHYV